MNNLSIIVAMSYNNVIGNANDLPWVLKNDLKKFANLTRGHTVIMGLNTFNSILNKIGSPLKDRTTLVLSYKNISTNYDNVLVFTSLIDLLVYVENIKDDVFVAGGGMIYKQLLPYCSKLYITKVATEVVGDTYFPKIDDSIWTITSEGKFKKDEKNEFDYEYLRYERKNEMPQVYLKNDRNKEQIKVMKKILKDGVCPFCVDNLKKYHKKKILKKGKYWLLTSNQWPYDNTKLHLLAISIEHMETLQDLPVMAGAELFKFFKWAEKEFKVAFGGIGMRFGYVNNTGATVRHLHAHFIVPDKDKKESEPIRFKIG